MKVATAIAAVASADNEEGKSVSGWLTALSVVCSEEALVFAEGNNKK